MATRERRLRAPRSPKAGKPPEQAAETPWVRRRRKTVTVAVRKGATVLQTEHGPRVVRGAKTPKVKKR